MFGIRPLMAHAAMRPADPEPVFVYVEGLNVCLIERFLAGHAVKNLIDLATTAEVIPRAAAIPFEANDGAPLIRGCPDNIPARRNCGQIIQDIRLCRSLTIIQPDVTPLATCHC